MERIDTHKLNRDATRIALTSAGHFVPAITGTLGQQAKALREACARAGIAPVLGFDRAEVMARARAAYTN